MTVATSSDRPQLLCSRRFWGFFWLFWIWAGSFLLVIQFNIFTFQDLTRGGSKVYTSALVSKLYYECMNLVAWFWFNLKYCEYLTLSWVLVVACFRLSVSHAKQETHANVSHDAICHQKRKKNVGRDVKTMNKWWKITLSIHYNMTPVKQTNVFLEW